MKQFYPPRPPGVCAMKGLEVLGGQSSCGVRDPSSSSVPPVMRAAFSQAAPRDLKRCRREETWLGWRCLWRARLPEASPAPHGQLSAPQQPQALAASQGSKAGFHHPSAPGPHLEIRPKDPEEGKQKGILAERHTEVWDAARSFVSTCLLLLAKKIWIIPN